jgi:hypothetical protein
MSKNLNTVTLTDGRTGTVKGTKLTLDDGTVVNVAGRYTGPKPLLAVDSNNNVYDGLVKPTKGVPAQAVRLEVSQRHYGEGVRFVTFASLASGTGTTPRSHNVERRVHTRKAAAAIAVAALSDKRNWPAVLEAKEVDVVMVFDNSTKTYRDMIVTLKGRPAVIDPRNASVLQDDYRSARFGEQGALVA